MKAREQAGADAAVWLSLFGAPAMPTRKSRTFRRRGFTLVELLVVLTILGICAAMTIANVGNQSDLILAASARSVMADWTYAQTRAMSLRKKIFIQHVGNQYSLMTRASAASPLVAIQNPVSHDDYNVAFGSGVGPLSRVSLAQWGFGSASIVGFDELGCPFTYDSPTNTCTAMTTSGSLSIAIGNTGITMTINPFTGDLSTN